MDVCEEARIRGNDAFAREEWDVAISAYGAGVSARASTGKTPDHRLFSNRSAAYISKYLDVRRAGLDLRGLLTLAVSDAETATAMKPSMPKPWYRLVIAHLVDGNPSAANAALQTGLSHCPNDSDLFRVSHFLRTKSFDDYNILKENFSSRPGDSELRYADSALHSGDFATSIKWYTRSIDVALRARIHPDRRAYCNRSAAWLQIATSTDSEHAFAAAFADADRCIAIDDAWPKAWLRKGTAFLEDGRPGCAKDTFEQGLSNCPLDGELLGGLSDSIMVLNSLGPEMDCEEAKSKGSYSDSNEQCDPFPASRYGFAVSDRSLSRQPAHVSRCSVPTDHRSDSESSETVPLERAYKKLSGSKNESSTYRGPVNELESKRCCSTRKHGVNKGHICSNTNVDVRLGPSDCNCVPITAGYKDEINKSPPAPRRLRSAPAVTFVEAADMDEDSLPLSQRILSLHNEEQTSDLFFLETNASSVATKRRWSQCASKSQPVTLYDLLGVVQTADVNEIKKAYYALARRLHPDKNQCDPEATKKFQELVDAYRVLSDSKSRALYDKYGKYELARNGLGSVDPSTLFSMVFGSDYFGHLIGELQVASLANAVDENGNAPASDVLDRIQKDRVGKLAVQLIRMVDPWVTGRQIEFMDWAVSETQRLSSANFGTQLLHVVGRAYCACSTFSKTVCSNRRGVRALQATISSVVADGMYRTQRARAQLRASAAADRVLAKQRRAHDRVLRLGRGGKSLTAAQSERMAIEMAECAVDMMWKLAVVDIETTIADVVTAVLSCKDISTANDDIVQSRAAAILVLGRAFLSAKT